MAGQVMRVTAAVAAEWLRRACVAGAQVVRAELVPVLNMSRERAQARYDVTLTAAPGVPGVEIQGQRVESVRLVGALGYGHEVTLAELERWLASALAPGPRLELSLIHI